MKNNSDPIKILVVDDEQDLRDGCERILKRMDCDVTKAENGEAALNFLEKESDNISIVLLDLKMPGMDGLEVLSRIKQIDENILVIIITGFATIETAIKAMKQGAYDFIPKPFQPDQLRIVVKRAREKLKLTWEAEQLKLEKQRTLTDLGTEKSRIHTIIDSIPNGIVVTNFIGQVVLVNQVFRRIFDLDKDREPGEKIESYIQDKGLCEYITEISHGEHVDNKDILSYEFSMPGEKYFQAKVRAVKGEDNEKLGAVITIMDITAMKMLDMLKSEFVAKVSHELRSPLSTIHEQLALVLGDMGDEKTDSGDQHLLSRAKEKTQGLISLIGDLLDISRIEAGNECSEPQPVRVDELLKSIVDFMQVKAGSKKQSLTIEVPEKAFPEITADLLAIESIFGNLITNAIHYTQEGGKVCVKAFEKDNNIYVTVEDNGFGIDEKYLDKIFEKFYRVKNDDTRFITGTGLGLPIVKGLVDSLNGRINVESERKKGTKFTVVIPVN